MNYIIPTKIKKVLFVHLLILFICLIQFSVLAFVEASIFMVDFMKIEVLCLYLYTIISAKKYLEWTNLYLMFLLTFGVFILSRVILDVFGMYNFEWANKWNNFYFPLKTQIKILTFINLALLFVHLGVLISFFYKRKKVPMLSSYPNLEKVSVYMFFLSFPGLLVKYLIQFKFILQNGYAAVYDGSLKALSYPVWTFGSGSLMEISFCLFLSSKPNKKKFIFISILFFVLKIADVLKGGRSKLFLPIFFIAWIYFSFYASRKLSIKKGVIYGLIGILISQSILIFRDSNNVVAETGEFFVTIFFAQQGISLLVLSYMIFYKASFINTGLPYLFYPLTLFASPGGQSYEYVQNTNSLGHKLTYFLSPDGYLNGEGIGSSFLGELYDLGLVGFVLGCTIIGVFISYYEYICKHSRVWLLISLYIVQVIVYMPRASILPNVKDIIIVIISYFILHFIITYWPWRTKGLTIK